MKEKEVLVVMKTQELSECKKELTALCNAVKTFASEGEYQKCKALIFDAMGKYPNAPEPHNLLGVLLEKQGDHPAAMKHFRAAWALDPTYLPAKQNLDSFGTFFSHGSYAFDENDCPEEMHDQYRINYDERGIGHIDRRNCK
ncbi:hypothetical protein [Caproicibacter sp.]|uniref:hypothetical protein n=1 Tax=Caproicibacter sp. TaxID=2814884 RepID=UPI003988BD0F